MGVELSDDEQRVWVTKIAIRLMLVPYMPLVKPFYGAWLHGLDFIFGDWADGVRYRPLSQSEMPSLVSATE